jgi:hypothetical protein
LRDKLLQYLLNLLCEKEQRKRAAKKSSEKEQPIVINISKAERKSSLILKRHLPIAFVHV